MDEIEKRITEKYAELKAWQKKINVFGANSLYLQKVADIEAEIVELKLKW
jgi:hypothetical protein